MTKAELVAAIAERSGLTRNQGREALEAFIGCVTDTVKGGQEVRIVGFGSFVPVERPAGVARNPRTGAQVQREASRTVRFRPGESLKGAMK
jgi:DNA-binding protein HU-beta